MAKNTFMLKGHEKHIFFGLLAFIAVISFFILKPFLNAILGACVIVYLFYPMYKWLLKKIKKEWAASLIVTLTVVLIIIIPSAFVLTSVYKEAASTVKIVQDYIPETDLTNDCNENNIGELCKIINKINDIIPQVDIEDNIKGAIIEITSFLKDTAYKAVITISTGIAWISIMLFIVFFLLIDGEKLVVLIKESLMLRNVDEESIEKTLKETTRGVVYGNIIVALVQGIVAGIGYWLIADMQNPILWAVITAFVALIPTIGTALVWAPISLIMVGLGLATHNYGDMTRGIILAVYGLLIISTIDNILKPKIIGDRTGVHPVLVLLGVLGGLKFFGIIGIIVGPVVLAIFVTMIKLYIKSYKGTINK